jgi:hypothetical protein
MERNSQPVRNIGAHLKMLHPLQEEFKLRKAFEWAIKETRSFDTWLLILTVINWLHIWLLSRGSCNGVANPWFCDWTWYGAPNRLLVAALLIRSRRSWLRVVGFLFSAHVLAGQLFFLFNPDEANLIWWWGGEAGGNFWQHIFWTLMEHELTQGFLAALMVFYSFCRFFRHPFRGPFSKVFKFAVSIGIIILMLGYASNFISHSKAEKLTAKWILNDIIKGTALYGSCVEAGGTFLEESATRFASVGANVLKFDCSTDLGTKVPWGEVGNSSFTGPFLISVGYASATSDAASYKSGHCLVLNCFGYAKILNNDSMLFRQMLTYLYPY